MSEEDHYDQKVREIEGQIVEILAEQNRPNGTTEFDLHGKKLKLKVTTGKWALRE